MTISENQLKTAFLRARQALPLTIKIQMSLRRIRNWYDSHNGNVYVSLSGKDSHVLLHLVRSILPDVQAAFVDTGLEYPEVRKLNLNTPDCVVLKPKMNFTTVIEKYGWPVVSKKVSQYISEIQKPTDKNKNTVKLRLTGIRSDGSFSPMSKVSNKWKFLVNAPFKVSDKCCKVMKKQPLQLYTTQTGKFPFIGTLAAESSDRESTWIKNGCNSYDTKDPKSTPLIFWTEQDILQYIKLNNISVAECYGELQTTETGLRFSGTQRTGCMFCMFGVHFDASPNRFQTMEHTHPALHNYCINNLGCGYVLDYLNIPHSAGVDGYGQFDLFVGVA